MQVARRDLGGDEPVLRIGWDCFASRFAYLKRCSRPRSWCGLATPSGRRGNSTTPISRRREHSVRNRAPIPSARGWRFGSGVWSTHGGGRSRAKRSGGALSPKRAVSWMRVLVRSARGWPLRWCWLWFLGAVRPKGGVKAHVCLPGFSVTTSQPGLCFTTSQPGLCFTTSQPGPSPPRRRPPAYRAPPARPAARRNRTRQTCAQQPRVAPLLRSKPATLPTATRVTPDRLDNPNRPVSILSNSEPALCASRADAQPLSRSRASLLAPICASLPEAPGGGRPPKPAPRLPRLAGLPGRNHRSGGPPHQHGDRHFTLAPAWSRPWSQRLARQGRLLAASNVRADGEFDRVPPWAT